MTAPGTAQSRPALAGLTMPPWLWVWLIYLLAGMPAVISGTYSGVVAFGDVSMPPQVGDRDYLAVIGLSLIFAVLVYAMLVAGVVAVVFPQLRSRWVEWRFKLASDDRPVMTEMQRFVDSHDPSIRLRVSLRDGQMARIYPVGWRSARIAVFRPLPVLWRRDRKAAQAILLHEVAHRRQGDQLIMGLGSPFVWLIRIGASAYLLLVLVPAIVYLAAGGGMMGSFIAGFAATLAGLIPGVIFLPVIALWLAEFNADQQAAQAIGPGALQRALRAVAGPRGSMAARAIALLSHPPRRLRLRRAAARPAGTVALIAAWPAGLVAFSLILPFVIDAPVSSVDHLSPSMRDIVFKEVVHAKLVQDMPLVIATAVVLLAWPVLAAPWERLWSSGPRPARHQPWWPCLATASLPVGMLLLSLAPLQASTQELIQAALPGRNSQPAEYPPLDWGTVQPQDACSSWVLGKGLTEYGRVSTEFYQLMQAGDNKTVMAADARRLDAAIRAALDNPPPGAARSIYTEAMTDYRTAAQEFIHTGALTAAGSNAMIDALNSYAKAMRLIGCP